MSQEIDLTVFQEDLPLIIDQDGGVVESVSVPFCQAHTEMDIVLLGQAAQTLAVRARNRSGTFMSLGIHPPQKAGLRKADDLSLLLRGLLHGPFNAYEVSLSVPVQGQDLA